MPAITQQLYVDPRDHVLCVTFMKVGKLYYFDYLDFPDLTVDDYVIVQTEKLGLQMGQVKAIYPKPELEKDTLVQNTILRQASPADLLLNQQWKDKEVAALIDCREEAATIGGYERVKFVAAEYNFDGSLLTYLYTIEERDRINTNRLRSAMRKRKDSQVEFRQVGPRDVAKAQEGFGACGIPRCCSTFLTDFSMVSINMAKAQGISLNPAEITGMCGRLRCCLLYEYEQYVEARKSLPRMRKRIGTPHGEGRVIDVHPLRDGVTVVIDDNRVFVSREEIIPLDEWYALRDAAASPCSKSDSGGCDCGAKRPRGTADEMLEEIGLPTSEQVKTSPSPEADDRPKRERRSGSRRRGQASNRRQGKGRKPKDKSDKS